jgi:hypothetical protein
MKIIITEEQYNFLFEEEMFGYTTKSHLFEDGTPKREFNGVSGQDFSEEEVQRLYELFKQSYQTAVGTSWAFDKFRQRIQNWYFYGDSDGFVTAKKQMGGLVKLTGSAGNPRSIVLGFQKLAQANQPTWGVVTPGIADTLTKRGFIRPSKELIVKLFDFIPKSVFGDANISLNPDGTMTYSASDVGTIEKTFIANKAYFQFLNGNSVFLEDMSDEIKNAIQQLSQ